MCTINEINRINIITQIAITNTEMYSGSEPSCLLHPLPKITTWEFHYIHPEYSRVVFKGSQLKPHLVLNRLTKNLSWFQRLTNNLRWFQRLTNNLCWFQRLTNNLTWFQG